MIILFGIRRRRKQLAVVFTMCQRCQRPCAHSVACIQTWFTLFFIPLIPLGSKYLTVCSLCAASTRIDKAQAEHLQLAASQQASQPVQMTPDGPLSPLAPLPPGPAAAYPAVPPLPPPTSGHAAWPTAAAPPPPPAAPPTSPAPPG